MREVGQGRLDLAYGLVVGMHRTRAPQEEQRKYAPITHRAFLASSAPVPRGPPEAGVFGSIGELFIDWPCTSDQHRRVPRTPAGEVRGAKTRMQRMPPTAKVLPSIKPLRTAVVLLICLCSLFQIVVWPTYISILMICLHAGLGTIQVLFTADFTRTPESGLSYYLMLPQYLFRSLFIFSNKLEFRGSRKPNLQYIDLVYYFLTFLFFHTHFTHVARPLGAALDGTVLLPERDSGTRAMMGHGTQDLFRFVEDTAQTNADVAFFEWPRDAMTVDLVPYYGYKTVDGARADQVS